MAEAISDLVRRLTEHFAQVEIHLKEEWNSSIPEHREIIRRELACHLTAHGDHSEVMDLSVPPRSHLFSISISHSPLAGGFATAPSTLAIGFDIEDVSRTFEKAVARIASADELRNAPSPAALWVAKEAVLKARQLSLVSEARIGAWKTLDKFFWEFSTTNAEEQGIVVQNSRLILGLFVSPA